MATLSSHAIKDLAAQIMSPSDETRRIRFIYDAKSLRGDAPHLVLCGTCSWRSDAKPDDVLAVSPDFSWRSPKDHSCLPPKTTRRLQDQAQL